MNFPEERNSRVLAELMYFRNFNIIIIDFLYN